MFWHHHYKAPISILLRIVDRSEKACEWVKEPSDLTEFHQFCREGLDRIPQTIVISLWKPKPFDPSDTVQRKCYQILRNLMTSFDSENNKSFVSDIIFPSLLWDLTSRDNFGNCNRPKIRDVWFDLTLSVKNLTSRVILFGVCKHLVSSDLIHIQRWKVITFNHIRCYFVSSLFEVDFKIPFT